VVHLDNARTVDLQPLPTRPTVEYVPRSDLRVSLLLMRDLATLSLLILSLMLAFGVMAITRRPK
jgi:hypothetical protein